MTLIRPFGPTEHVIGDTVLVAKTVDVFDDFDPSADECELEPHAFENYELPLSETRTHACGYLGCGGSRLSPIHYI